MEMCKQNLTEVPYGVSQRTLLLLPCGCDRTPAFFTYSSLHINVQNSSSNPIRCFCLILYTSTYPKKPELISPAGKPIAIIFSVI